MTNLSPSLLLRKIQPPRQRGQKFLNHKAKKITAGGKPYALRYNRIKRTKSRGGCLSSARKVICNFHETMRVAGCRWQPLRRQSGD